MHEVSTQSVVAALATAIYELSKQEVPEGPAAYDDDVQRVYNHVVLRTLIADGYETPGSVPGMLDMMAGQPLCKLLPGDLGDDEDAVLLSDARRPTQECMERIVNTNRDVMGEKFENAIMKRVFQACQAAESPESYVAFRRLLISEPTLTKKEMTAWFTEIDLQPVAEILEACYTTAPASLCRDGRYAQCDGCGCLLRPAERDEWQCDLDRCRGSRTRVRRYLDADTPGGVHHLEFPLRVFVTGPGIFEVGLERKLRKRGLKVLMWPAYDAYDLLITFPDGTRWAIDVKDYAHPGILGARFPGFRSNPPADKKFLVVPDYRNKKRYRLRFGNARKNAGKSSMALTFEKELLQEVDKKHVPGPANGQIRKEGPDA
ncbi:hypothetical protein [Myceligenerans crystallogenes]|uniref:REase associating with pPIWI RE domain-containing protein n=1 Tax=Myceligenerans crystallogenes TaxID=316335 RepID=A0ABN2NM43_9MICO